MTLDQDQKEPLLNETEPQAATASSFPPISKQQSSQPQPTATVSTEQATAEIGTENTECKATDTGAGSRVYSQIYHHH